MASRKLFVDKIIEVSAPLSAVWRVITDPQYTKQWASEFAANSSYYIESDWGLGDDVLWKNEEGVIIVEGKVTANEKPFLLRFTVFAANSPHMAVTSEDGITWQLTEKAHNLIELRARQGDFGSVEGGKENYQQTEQTWSRVLPIVKRLAEDFR